MPSSLSREELLRERLARFTRMLHGLENGNVRALHRTRVASRRLRELIPVLELDGKDAHGLTGRLKKVTKRLGGAREVDVLLLLVDELQEARRYDRDTLSTVVATLVEDRTAARKRLFARLPIPEIKRL